MWLVGNTIGESVQLRSKVLSQTSIIDSLSSFVYKMASSKQQVRLAMVNNLIWCLRNLLMKTDDGPS